MKKLRFETTLMMALMAMQKKEEKKVRSIVTWCGHYFGKA
jgi:predicted hydrocarbon binding protein